MKIRAAICLVMLLSPACTTQALQREKSTEKSRSSKPDCVHLNSATAEELEELEGVGEVIARRIVEYRQRHGPFRRTADVIIVEGFSEEKYRAIEDRICID